MSETEAASYLFGAAAKGSPELRAEALQTFLLAAGGYMTEPEWHVIELYWSENYGPHRGDMVPFAEGKIDAFEFLARINGKRRQHRPESAEKFEKTTLDKLTKFAARIIFARKYVELHAMPEAQRIKAARAHVVKELQTVPPKTISNWLPAKPQKDGEH